jgi:hypothetical protein
LNPRPSDYESLALPLSYAGMINYCSFLSCFIMIVNLPSFQKKQIEPRFDRIDKKLEEHDKKFNDLLTHFDQIIKDLID